MLGKISKLFKILYYYIKDRDNLLLYLIKMKAYESLKGCYRLTVRNTEELEDLLFHIKTYLEIPEAVAEILFPKFKNVDVNKVLNKYKKGKLTLKEAKEYADYLLEVEKQRVVERDFIFENVKILSFGFEI